LPECLSVGVGASSGTEERDVPVDPRAKVPVRSQVRLEPEALRGTRPASPGGTAIGIQCDQVPGANVETVIPLARQPRCRAKISKVACRTRICTRAVSAARGQVLVIPHRGTRDRLDASPAQVIRLQPGLIATAVVLNVAQR